MENLEKNYCRFCAEPKDEYKLLNFMKDDKMCDEIQLKLVFMNAVYVDVKNDCDLPKTVCLVCYESLNNAYEFLNSVKKAQDVLSDIVASKETYSCNDFEEEPPSCSDFTSQSPGESSVDVKVEDSISETVEKFSIHIKPEPKEELESNHYQSEDNDENERSPVSVKVEDLINGTLTSLPNSVTLFSTDLPEKSKRIITKWNEYPWVCAFCNIEFLDVDMLRSHSKLVHEKCAAFMCIDCKTTDKVEFRSFIKHVWKHRNTLKEYCVYCDKIVSGKSAMEKHMKSHYKKPKVPCPLCGEIVPDEEHLKNHLELYNMVKQKRGPRRKRGAPITEAELTCPLCNKVYKNLNSLRDHRKLHVLDRKKNYTCDRCGKMFYSKGSLTSHIMAHDKVKPHVCRICNRSFTFPNMLRRHVEMHSGVKPFSCEQCGRCFRLRYQLKAHKIIHTDAMPYVCQYCNKAFRFKQILKNHERQHTGAKPYACQHCGMEFTNWSNFNKHMKRRHNVDTSKKKITPDGVFPINPQTGQLVQLSDVVDAEEWRNRIMVPEKKRKQKIKKENT